MKRILGCVRRAVEEFDLIKDGDKIAVGVSGGKDSITLLYALKLFQRFSPVNYELEAITVTLGFDNFDITPIENFCEKIEVPLSINETLISKIVFDVKKEKNPCSLCANMRRGALHTTMQKRNCNVLALGHHSDDVIETLFLNLFYTGRIKTFSPKTYLTRRDVTVIRPMLYATEHQVIGAIRRHDLPTVKNPCPANENTKREEIKDYMKQIYKNIPPARNNIMTALKNEEQLDLWFKKSRV